MLGALFNTFIIVVLTMYFLASLPKTKAALYRLAPASRRDRVSELGDQIFRNIGGYVSGAFVVAMCAGISSLVFLFAVGLGKYAVALAFVVALLDVIPMIGATIGAVVVTAIGFATDPKIGLACLIFYIIYQQVENYAIYPRVMSKAVDIPGAVTVIAALVGAALLGVVGALLAIPTAAAILMLTKEVFIRRQDDTLTTPRRRARSCAPRCRSCEGSPVSSSLTITTPARITSPPSSWTGRGSSPSSSQANTSEATTSVSATNDASREPSRRPAAIPVT